MKRKIFHELAAHLEKRPYTLLTGARQTGKSTLLKQLQEYVRDKGQISLFLNLEDKRVLSDLNENPEHLLKYLPKEGEKSVVFVDEIQYLEDPGHFLKLLYDRYADNLKIVASGSSAFYLNSQFKDSLAGRKRIFQLFTCDFEDFLMLQGKEDLWQDTYRLAHKEGARSVHLQALRVEFEKYILYGGYPAVVMEPDVKEKIELLKELRDAFIKRDVMEAGVQNEELFYRLFRILAAQCGQLTNTNELSVTLGSRHETIGSYLLIMQKCFHLALIKPYSRNLRKELTKMPKAYLLDTGLRNSLVQNFQPFGVREDRGILWEQVVFLRLLQRYGLDSIRYWRTSDQKELDFIVQNSEGPSLAIEAKYDNKRWKASKYRQFLEAYPEFSLQLSYYEPYDEGFFRRYLFPEGPNN